MLNASHIQSFERDGIVIAPYPLSAVTVEAMREKMDAFLAARPDLSPDYIPDLIAYDRSWLDFAERPEILDSVAAVLGEDIVLWGSGLFCKRSRGGRATPWHQDAQYWPIRPLETVTVWIALDRSDTENGCLRVRPGSHSNRVIYGHNVDNSDAFVLNQALDEEQMNGMPVMDVELSPGQFSIHDAYLIHGAEPNLSGRRRAGITFRYMPASSHFDRELARAQVRELGVVDISERELHLVRGRDTCGKNDLFQRH